MCQEKKEREITSIEDTSIRRLGDNVKRTKKGELQRLETTETTQG